MGLQHRTSTDQREEERRPQAGASLDQRTLLDQRLRRLVRGSPPPPVLLSTYPTAAEAVIVHHDPSRRVESEIEDPGPSESCGPSEWADLDEAERERRNWERANGRAFSESRRFFVANRLRYMWVLTFTGLGLHDAAGRDLCMKLVAKFVRRFRRRFGELAYWYSPELHPKGHGWHVNFFVARRLPHDQVAELWEGRPAGDGVSAGHVWVSDKTKDPRVVSLGLSFVEALRLGALYARKYASKDWSPENVQAGAHRFVAATGFKPEKSSVRVSTMEVAVERAIEVFGEPPSSVWRSADCADWDGPPVMVLRWSVPAEGATDG